MELDEQSICQNKLTTKLSLIITGSMTLNRAHLMSPLENDLIPLFHIDVKNLQQRKHAPHFGIQTRDIISAL